MVLDCSLCHFDCDFLTNCFKACIIHILYRHWWFFRQSKDKELRISPSLVLRVVFFCVYRVVTAMYVYLPLILPPFIFSMSSSPEIYLLILSATTAILFPVRMGWLFSREPRPRTPAISQLEGSVLRLLTLSRFGLTCCKPQVRFLLHPSAVPVHVSCRIHRSPTRCVSGLWQ